MMGTPVFPFRQAILRLSVKEISEMDGVLDVGFIGLGNMGTAMARNLIKAGHRAAVYNRTRAKAEALAAEGARLADRISGACRNEVLITCSLMMLRSKPHCLAWTAPNSTPRRGSHPYLHEHD